MNEYSKRIGFSRLRRLVAGGLVLVAMGCGREPRSEASQTVLTVFAATSLRDAFGAMAQEHQRRHPDVRVVLNFGGTQELRAQLEQGADADVFAAADTKHVLELERRGLLGPGVPFAENEPVLVVAKHASSKIVRFSSLPDAERVVLGAPEVPIGRYAAQILENANKSLQPDFASRVEARVVSRELNVRQVLAKVALGEADAGIVYRTDVVGDLGGAVAVLSIPSEVNVVARYPIAAVTRSAHAAEARAFIGTVISEAGRAITTKAGFRAPSGANSSL